MIIGPTGGPASFAGGPANPAKYAPPPLNSKLSYLFAATAGRGAGRKWPGLLQAASGGRRGVAVSGGGPERGRGDGGGPGGAAATVAAGSGRERPGSGLGRRSGTWIGHSLWLQAQ